MVDISTNPYLAQFVITQEPASSSQANADAFAATMNSATSQTNQTEKKKTKRQLERETTDAEIKAFFDKMKKDGGAQGFVTKMNLDKIEELIKKREEDLKAANGVYNNPPLTPEQMTAAMKAVKEGVAEYKKQLLKELEEKSKEEKKQAAITASTASQSSSTAQTTKPKITSLADLLSAL